MMATPGPGTEFGLYNANVGKLAMIFPVHPGPDQILHLAIGAYYRLVWPPNITDHPKY